LDYPFGLGSSKQKTNRVSDGELDDRLQIDDVLVAGQKLHAEWLRLPLQNDIGSFHPNRYPPDLPHLHLVQPAERKGRSVMQSGLNPRLPDSAEKPDDADFIAADDVKTAEEI
jgi:hypothetical protein